LFDLFMAPFSQELEPPPNPGRFMLVTTSSLEPGAQSVCTQRGYPINVIDRVKLRAWINAMRTPGRGAELST
jgi:hypothetical protein